MLFLLRFALRVLQSVNHKSQLGRLHFDDLIPFLQQDPAVQKTGDAESVFHAYLPRQPAQKSQYCGPHLQPVGLTKNTPD